MAREMTDFATSAARTTTGNGSTIPVPAASTEVAILLDVTAVSGTTPSMTVTVQWSNDATNWADADGTADSFAAITAASKKVKTFPTRAKFARLSWAITGTTPSFTFSASAVSNGSRAFA